MASYSYNSSYTNRISENCSRISSRLQSRIDDYAGIRNQLRYYPDETGGLDDSRAYLQIKMNELSEKKSQVHRLKEATLQFADNIETIDNRVATRINTATDKFYDTHHINSKNNNWIDGIYAYFGDKISGLKKFIKKTLGELWDDLKNVWDSIIQFYEEHKYVFDVIFDVLAVIAATVAMINAGGFVVGFVATWGLLKATHDLLNDSIAFQYHVDGNDEKAEQYSHRTFRDDIVSGAALLGEVFGQNRQEWKDYARDAYDIIDTVAIVCDTYKSGKNIVDMFKNGKLSKMKKHENGFVKNLFGTDKNISHTDFMNTKNKLNSMDDIIKKGIQTRAKNTLRYKNASMSFQTAQRYTNTMNVMKIQTCFGTSDNASVMINNGVNFYKGAKNIIMTTDAVMTDNFIESLKDGKITLTTPSKALNTYNKFIGQLAKLNDKVSSQQSYYQMDLCISDFLND